MMGRSGTDRWGEGTEGATMDALVSTEWLAGQLDDPAGRGDLRVLDCTVVLEPAEGGGFRAVSGRERWAEGHIPGSGFADLIVDLSDPESPLRFTRATPERFATAMGRLGVGVGTRVVLYDRRLNTWAARLWWMLRAFGFDDAAVLDGGWRAWTTEGRPTAAGPEPARSPTVFHARPRPGLFVDRAEVLDALADGATCLLNALSEAQHRGEESAYGRAGHLPGSRNVPAADLVDPDTHRYLPEAALRSRFAPVLDDPAVGRIVTYCGGGIAASSDAFTLWRLGRGDVAVYDASLQEWAADPTLPLVVGE